MLLLSSHVRPLHTTRADTEDEKMMNDERNEEIREYSSEATMGRSLALRFGWRAGEEGKGGKKDAGRGETLITKKRDREEIEEGKKKKKKTIESR